MTRLPLWLSARRVALLASIVVGGAAGIATYAAYLRNRVLSSSEDAVSAGGEATLGLVGDWESSRRSQVARLAQFIAARSRALSAAPLGAEKFLQAFAGQGGFESAVVLDHSRALIARAIIHDDTAGNYIPGVGQLAPASADGVTVWAHLVDESRPVIDFSAPVMSNGIVSGWVAMRAVLNQNELASRNATRMGPETQVERITLVALDRDSAIVIALRDAAPRLAGRQSSLQSTLPAQVRNALNGRRERGVATGLDGRRVVYTAIPVPGLPWAIISEADVDDVLGQLRVPIAINDGVFAVLLALIVIVIGGAWRSAQLRREHDLAQLRSEFASSVSHELRTPLTQIRMYAEMMQKGLLPQPAEAERALRVIAKESERLSILVDNVLDFARLRRTVSHDAAPVDVAEAVQRATESFGGLAAERESRIEVCVVPGTRARIENEALQQVLLNLIENAAKYGPRGQRIRIGAAEGAGVTRIWVDDEGPGVPHGERDDIWRAFHRGSLAVGSTEAGTGIGLAVVREIAVQYGGRAFVESVPGQDDGTEDRDGGGARFVIELPSL